MSLDPMQVYKDQLEQDDTDRAIERDRLRAEVERLQHAAGKVSDDYETAMHRVAQLEAEVERLRAVEAELWYLINESGGVYGIHLNGDPSPWDELLPGGRFERLPSLRSSKAPQPVIGWQDGVTIDGEKVPRPGYCCENGLQLGVPDKACPDCVQSNSELMQAVYGGEKVQAAVRDNPDLPPEFVADCLVATAEAEAGLATPYQRVDTEDDGEVEP